MSKYLIVNADDFGMCRSANEAVMDLFRDNKLFSSTVMMPCAFAEDAVKFSIDNPQYAIGVHLTMTSEWKKWRWKPLSDSPSLIDEEGYIWPESPDVQKHAKLSELEAEIRAQIDRAHALGMKPSHIDNHMGSLYGYQTGKFHILKMTLRVIGEYGYAFRLYTKTAKCTCPNGFPYPLYAASTVLTKRWSKKYGVIVPDYLIFPEWTKDLRDNGFEHYRDEILKVWTNIPDGVTETFVHPALESDEIKGISNVWRDRVWEHRLMKDPYTHEYLANHGIKMINFRDLVEMRKGK